MYHVYEWWEMVIHKIYHRWIWRYTYTVIANNAYALITNTHRSKIALGLTSSGIGRHLLPYITKFNQECIHFFWWFFYSMHCRLCHFLKRCPAAYSSGDDRKLNNRYKAKAEHWGTVHLMNIINWELNLYYFGITTNPVMQPDCDCKLEMYNNNIIICKANVKIQIMLWY